MNITLLCVGKLKEKYWQEAAAEYLKRLSRFGRVEVREVKEERLPDNPSPSQERAVIEAEGAALLRALPPHSYAVALDIHGESLDSPALAQRLDSLALEGVSHLTFIIGGSLGLAPTVLAAARWRLSFSPLTFPHQLMRVILLEQLYRAAKISAHETYHK